MIMMLPTRKYRQLVKHQYPFTTDSFNPLREIPPGFHEAKDARALAEVLTDPNFKMKKDKWDRAALTLLIGVILHTLYDKKRKNKTLGGVIEFLSNSRRPVWMVLKIMETTKHDSEGMYNWVDASTGRQTQTHPIVASIASEFKKMPYEELCVVVDVATIFVKVFHRNAPCSEFFRELNRG